MKLLYCKYCGDIFNLSFETKRCECGKTVGKYINLFEAIVSKHSTSIAIGNGSFDDALTRLKLKGEDYDREHYIENCRVEYVWLRPNEGKGNPNTSVMAGW